MLRTSHAASKAASRIHARRRLVGERMMNGMNRGCFCPGGARADHYWMRYFGVCWYDIDDLHALPDVAISSSSGDGPPAARDPPHRAPGRSDHDLFAPVCALPPMSAWLQANVSPAAGASPRWRHFAAPQHRTVRRRRVGNLRLNRSPLCRPSEGSLLINHTADTAHRRYIPTATALRAGISSHTRHPWPPGLARLGR